MPEKRINIWFRVAGGITILSAPIFYFLIRSGVEFELMQQSGTLKKSLTVMSVAFCVSLVFCGLMMVLLASQAASGDKTAQLGTRISSIYLFATMSGIFLLGHRPITAYLLILSAAINLVGLCPLCNRRRRAMFQVDDHSDPI